MKETDLTLVNECLEEDIPIWDQFVEDELDTLIAGIRIEETIGSKYEEWTPEDIQKAYFIFGQEKMDEFIGKKEVPLMYEAEKEALGG
jgi:hypothetical protein